MNLKNTLCTMLLEDGDLEKVNRLGVGKVYVCCLAIVIVFMALGGPKRSQLWGKFLYGGGHKKLPGESTS